MKSIILIGSVPPPHHGVCIQNQLILNSKIKNEFELIHLSNSYKKNIRSVGTFNLFGILSAILSYLKLFRYLFCEKSYVVYMTLAQNNIGFIRDSIYILIGKLFKNTKVLIHCRGSIYYKHYCSLNNLLKKYFDYVYSKTDYCIVLGNRLKNMMSKWFSEDEVFIVPNGTIFKNRFNNDDKENNNIILGYIGIISEQKGIYELLNSFQDIHSKYNDVKLHIAGSFVDNETEKKVKNIILCNKLDDRIIFVGNVDGVEKEKFYNSIDVLLMPSWHEGHPNVILEALVSNLPIIASDVGAVSESVIENYNGFLIPAKDSSSLTEKIEILLNRNELIRTMGIKSYELYLEKFTEEIYINKMINVFNIITEK